MKIKNWKKHIKSFRNNQNKRRKVRYKNGKKKRTKIVYLHHKLEISKYSPAR